MAHAAKTLVGKMDKHLQGWLSLPGLPGLPEDAAFVLMGEEILIEFVNEPAG